MEQGEDPDERFVGVDAGLDGPAMEQSALLGQGECLAAEPGSGSAGQPAGGINEDDFVLTSPAEELAGCLQPPLPVGRAVLEERLDVADLNDRPVLFSSSKDKEGQVTHDAQRLLDRAVRTGTGSRPSGSFPRADQVIGEPGHRRSQRGGGGVDSALSTSVGEAGLLVETEGQMLADKEVFQRSAPASPPSVPVGVTAPAWPGDGRSHRPQRAGRRRRP